MLGSCGHLRKFVQEASPIEACSPPVAGSSVGAQSESGVRAARRRPRRPSWRVAAKEDDRGPAGEFRADLARRASRPALIREARIDRGSVLRSGCMKTFFQLLTPALVVTAR